MAKAYNKRVLGRGLSAILNDDDNKRFENISNSSSLNEIEISKISLNPNQPRTNFDQKSLDQLASSISELGLIQPITVQQSSEDFILISGERRLRAFKLLNLKESTDKPCPTGDALNEDSGFWVSEGFSGDCWLSRVGESNSFLSSTNALSFGVVAIAI